MKVLIADDEAPARQRLRRLLEATGHGGGVVEAGNGVEALERCAEAKPDVVLLDIRMPVMDGIEAARALTKLKAPPAVIFVTAYEEHALQAFDANATDYLLKPVRSERLERALKKIPLFSQARLVQALPPTGDRPRSHLCATTGGTLQVIPVPEIRYCRADQKYVAIRTARREFLLDESLKALNCEFSRHFVRVHRNALVAVDHIETLEKVGGHHYQVRLQGVTEPIAVSRRHLPSLRTILKNGSR